MSCEVEPRPGLLERAKADLLRPPTKAEMIFYGVCALDLLAVVGVGEVVNATQDPLWRVGADLFRGSSMTIGGMITISEFMYFFTGIDSDMRISGLLRKEELIK